MIRGGLKNKKSGQGTRKNKHKIHKSFGIKIKVFL